MVRKFAKSDASTCKLATAFPDVLATSPFSRTSSAHFKSGLAKPFFLCEVEAFLFSILPQSDELLLFSSVCC
uniref:Uncharacterized protein n=1 Tax=Arundo donax TaxID=35708 RepID=A0A0A9EIJ9_ARUDO